MNKYIIVPSFILGIIFLTCVLYNYDKGNTNNMILFGIYTILMWQFFIYSISQINNNTTNKSNTKKRTRDE